MTTHLESGLQHNDSVFGDLAALLCRGGLVVETPGEPGSVSVRSTIQLDGDMTLCVTRPTLGQASIFAAHMAEVETRIHRAARLVKRTVWATHCTIGAAVSVVWLCALIDSPALEDHLTTTAVWIGLSIGSATIIECLLQTSFVRKFFLSSIVNRLSRFAAR